MNMPSFKPPRTRAEFERNLNLLRYQIEHDKMRFPSRYSLEGLRRVRFLPNGRVDLLSIDQMTRLDANTVAQMADGLFDEMLRQHKKGKQEVEEAE